MTGKVKRPGTNGEGPGTAEKEGGLKDVGPVGIPGIPNLNQLLNDLALSGNVGLSEWLLFGFIIVGIIIKLFSLNLYTTLTPDQLNSGTIPIGPATGSIWGYSIILFACMGLVFVSVNPQKNNMEQLKAIPISLYAIMILLIWSIVLNFRFYSQINTTNPMPSQYNQWNNWSLTTIIMLSVIGFIDYLINNINGTTYDDFKGHLRVYTIVIFFAGIIVMAIQDTILNNFLVNS
jgi:hypothetical protein